MKRSGPNDERTISGPYRVVGFLGPQASCFTLAWLASHRQRLRTFLLGGKKLSVLVVWDAEGAARADRTDADVDAIAQLVYGAPPSSPRSSKHPAKPESHPLANGSDEGTD